MDIATRHLPIAAGVAITVVGILVVIYQLWTGPLVHLPGPTYSKFTGLVYQNSALRGMRIHYLQDLHKRYGPIVRVTPSEVSVADLESHQQIHKTAGGYLKTSWYLKFVATPITTMFNSLEPARHSQWRRLLGNSMSESTLKSFDPIIQSKIDLLMDQVRKEHDTKGYVDMYKWMHFFATDVIGELSFGESFRMLELGQPNQYIKDIQRAGTLGLLTVTLTGRNVNQLPSLPIWPLTELKQRAVNLRTYSNQAIDNYLAHRALNPNEPKPMFFDKVLGGKGQAASLSRDEINAQAGGFLVAGTDTTAVTATYMMYCIAQNPAVKAKLLGAIKNLPEKPTNEDLRAIPYLDHLIDETLRLYGAAPAPLPRAVPAGGRTLAGHFVPEATTVSPVAYVLHRDASIFPNPEMWIPERWENATKTMRDASFAFGGGSRVCIGLHLAKMELRGAVTAFFRMYPNAQVAWGSEGFGEEDMRQLEYFIVKPKGKRCLLK